MSGHLLLRQQLFGSSLRDNSSDRDFRDHDAHSLRRTVEMLRSVETNIDANR
jgi:hypothetical protein